MTTTTELATKAWNAPLFGQRTLHIFTLSGFAITQPLLVAVAQQTVYLRDQQIGWLEVGLLLTILMLVIPGLILGIDRIVLQLSRLTRGHGRNLVFVVLSAVVLLSLMRPLSSIRWIELTGVAGLLSVVIAIPLSWSVVYLYERTTWMQSWLTFASIGLMIFPASFIWKFNSIWKAERSIQAGIPVKNPVPVVLVVFDEFSGITLLNDAMQIDADRFPQLARLGTFSTFYRNATTVHPRTQVAVPAILSGRFPLTDRSPLASEYPGNLLQVIEATKKYEMAVFEAATRLCPINVRSIQPPARSTSQRCIDFVHTMAAVYPKLILSKDTPVPLPSIPTSWFGLSPMTTVAPEDPSAMTEGLFNYFSTANRARQFEHFVNCVLPSERPRFVFYHTVFPHYPWSFLPSGQQYEMESAAPSKPAGASGELGEDWLQDAGMIIRNEFRYRLQVGYLDRLIGQLLDRLEETGVMDRCLLIVTADHGVSFRSGHSRRLPDAETLADIMSVPLFVKLPGQTAGRVDDRNVESVDILPTIAEVLEIQLPEPVDGISVSEEKRQPRKTLYFESAMTIVEADLPKRRSAVRRQSEIFGSGKIDQPPSGIASHPDWHGRAVDSFSIDEQTIAYFKVDPLQSRYAEERPVESNKVDCFIAGRLESGQLPAIPAELVVARDGVIVDSGRTNPFFGRDQTFEFLLPANDPAAKTGHVDIYVVDQSDGGLRLRRLEDSPSQADHFQSN